MPYCQFCGTKLEENQTCTCELSQTASAQASAQPSSQDVQPAPPQPSAQVTANAKRQAVSLFKEFKSYLSAYIANPAEAVRSEVQKDDMTLPVILAVIRLLAMGLAIYGLLRRTCSIAFSMISRSALRYESTSDIVNAGIKASLSKSLLFGALIAAIGMLLFILAAFVLAKIQHEETSFLKVFKVSTANGVAPSALLLLSFLFSFFSIPLCIGFMGLAALSWVICGVLTVRIVCPNGHSGVFWTLYFVGAVLAVIVGFYVMPKLFLKAVGGIAFSYAGRTVELQTFLDTAANGLDSALNELGQGLKEWFSDGMKDLLEDITSEIWYSVF